jgi:hypothetical protein
MIGRYYIYSSKGVVFREFNSIQTHLGERVEDLVDLLALLIEPRDIADVGGDRQAQVGGGLPTRGQVQRGVLVKRRQGQAAQDGR